MNKRINNPKPQESKMKNKDGIELKVGQEWKSECGMIRKILGVCDKQFVTSTQETMIMPFKCWGLDYINTPLHTLISDPSQPWLPLPEGYRLVTDEERYKYERPIDWYCNSGGSGWTHNSGKDMGGSFSKGFKYAVPTDFTFEPKKPKYKMFEIDWTDRPHINSFWASVGSKHGDYRIFGFTDDKEWIMKTLCIQERQPNCVADYEDAPCDHTGNLKYAIGRLE